MLLVLGCLGLLAAFQVAWIGQVAVRPLPDGPVAAVARSASVGLLRLPDRLGCLAADHTAQLAAWERRIDALAWTHTSVTAESLSTPGAPAAVVVPAAPCLAPAEARSLTDYATAGGGLVLFTDTGTRDANGAAAGWAFLTTLLGVERLEVLPAASWGFVAVPGASPLGADLGGTRIEVAGPRRVLAVAAGSHPYWSDSRLLPADAALPAGYQTAALHAEHGMGRVAWIGFTQAASGEDGRSGERYQRLLRNALVWAAGVPAAGIEPWPAPHVAAVLLQADASAELQNLPLTTTALGEAGVRATFVLPPTLLRWPGSLARSLPEAGEVALGGTRQLLESGATRGGILRLRLDAARARWSLGVRPSGAAIGAGGMGTAVARMLLGVGVDHVLAYGDSDSVLPRGFEASQEWAAFRRRIELVRLARTTDDDLGLSPLGFPGLRSDWIQRRLDSDFAGVSALGGLYVLGFHTQGLGGPQGIAALQALVRDWRRRAWLAESRQIADWWRARSRLEARLATLGAGSLRLSLRNHARAAAREVAVTLWSSPGAATLSVTAGAPVCRVLPGPVASGAARVAFTLVAPGLETSCTLSPSR